MLISCFEFDLAYKVILSHNSRDIPIMYTLTSSLDILVYSFIFGHVRSTSA